MFKAIINLIVIGASRMRQFYRLFLPGTLVFLFVGAFIKERGGVKELTVGDNFSCFELLGDDLINRSNKHTDSNDNATKLH